MKKQEVARLMQATEEYLKRLEHLRWLAINRPDRAEMALGEMEQAIQYARDLVGEVTQLANTRTVTRAGVIPDGELIARFATTEPYKGERMFELTAIPNGEPNRVANWEKYLFTAPNKPQAVKIAREYADRIIRKKMVYVYLANRTY